VKLTVKLSKAGRRAFKLTGSQSLTAQATFTPFGQKPVIVTKRFKLNR
jgi:hypothetical protein